MSCQLNMGQGHNRSPKFKTEVGNDQLEFTGMIDFLNKVYICVYFFLYEYDILYRHGMCFRMSCVFVASILF